MNMAVDEELLRKANIALNKAKINLLNEGNTFFLSTVLFSLDLKWDTSCPTLATDGLSMDINPQFFLDFTPKLRMFGLLHEVWHVALSHMVRLENRNPKIWNYACDYIVNMLIKDSGIEIWEHALYDERFRNMTTEQVYDILMQEMQQNQQQQQNGLPGNSPGGLNPPDNPMGDDIKYPAAPTTQEEIQQIKEQASKINEILVKAYTIAKQQNDPTIGNLPADLERHIEKLLHPIVPWEKLFINWMTSQNKSDYTFSRPNRRFMPDFFMPSLYTKSLGEIAVICDTSGSIGPKELTRFYSECAHIKSKMDPDKFTIASFDTKIQSIYTFPRGKRLGQPLLKGGGGTKIDPVLQYLNETKPEIAVIFTDGEFREPTLKYKGKLLWLVYDNPTFTAPFGKVVHFKRD